MFEFLEYQINNIELLQKSNVLLDFRDVDFTDANPDELKDYISILKQKYTNKISKKRAALHSSEKGLVVSRVFKYIAGKDLNFQYQVFSDEKYAVDWLTDH